MAAHTAGLRIQRRRVEHIQQLMGEIADRQHTAAHLLAITFRAGYCFFALACLVAGLVGLIEGRRYLAETWGIAGIVLVILWIGAKVSQRVTGRAIGELRKELAKVRPGNAADAVSGAEPTGESAARRPGDHQERPPS